MSEIYDIFTRINKSGSNRISRAEMDTFINTLHSPLSPQDKSLIIKTIPKKGINFDEFKDVWESYINNPGDINRIEDVFAYSNKKGNGKITIDELKNIFIHLCEPKTEKDLIKLITIADTDGDGMVSLEEFKGILKK
ncbi:Calmodulin [Spraguea lophii 42_110]|uniref:Calmodulin n=1 Tax=Spraguea lophii (strain 42_110) TaxID=1358809 RepID=S7XIB4_SPRLO|nr:Calmodulin [Spraguea lophii 42_110]